MNKLSSANFTNDTRVHIGLRTSDLERATRFYSLLLGSDPVKQKVDYAKWETDDPSVNLSLTVGPPGKSSGGAHYGIQVKSTDAVAAAKSRFEAADVPYHSEDETVCCYALQDKFWIEDPDGNEWEVFVVLEDTEAFRSEASDCCKSEDAAVTTCC
jgi:catechol 2,3-dioxygenase-like lactoylglutathione lyase family enzyme